MTHLHTIAFFQEYGARIARSSDFFRAAGNPNYFAVFSDFLKIQCQSIKRVPVCNSGLSFTRRNQFCLREGFMVALEPDLEDLVRLAFQMERKD